MKHETSLYTTPGFDEWLIYCSISWKTFSLSIVSDDITYSGEGPYGFSGALELRFGITGLGKVIDVELKHDGSASRVRRLFGTAPLIGVLKLDHQDVGVCTVENSHSEQEPVIRLKSKPLGIALEVHRSNPGLVYSPLVVHGSEYWQSVLEKYLLVNRKRRRSLPKVRRPDDFIGSVRTVKYSRDPFGGELEAIGVIASITGLLVHPDYMTWL